MQQLIKVLWPSFLTAVVATAVFFTLFDPLDLVQDSSGTSPSEARLQAYSMGFFLFWLLTSLSCLLTSYFQKPPKQ